MNKWIINPEVDTVSMLTEYGRFLENDYRMIIEHLLIPSIFEEYTEKTGRKFVIVGGDETPWVLSKAVFLCLKLSGAESVVVLTKHYDEMIMVQNIFDYHSKGINSHVFNIKNKDFTFDEKVIHFINDATDIVVYGDQNTLEYFREYETVDRRVWEHDYKFSFGIVRSEQLTPTIINEICFDFFSFYGEGSLAPKFYFVVGKLLKKTIQDFSKNMKAIYGNFIQEYRDKMPLITKSNFIENVVKSDYVERFVRIEDIDSINIFNKLHGDIRLVVVDDMSDVEKFIFKYKEKITTIAVNFEDDMEMIDDLDGIIMTRICNIGDMQFPDFFEQYENVDDFIVYSDEEDTELIDFEEGNEL